MEGERVSFEQERRLLIEEYFNSTWYQQLKDQVRWNQFRSPSTSAAEWQTGILDADANNGDHGFVNAQIAETVCDLDHETDATRRLVFIACLLRDLGETKYGDINYDAKSKSQKLLELAHLSEILSGDDFTTLSPADVEDIINLRNQLPRSESASREVLTFQHIQRIGWLRTAMIAADAARTMSSDFYGNPDLDPSQYYKLLWLTHSVLGNHLPGVINSAHERPSAQLFLQSNQQLIDFCFLTLQRDDVQDTLHKYYLGINTSGTDPDYQERKLITARQLWKEFVQNSAETEYTLDPERYLTSLDHLRTVVNALRKQNKRIVLTSGSFDATHIAHMRYLQAASQRGDILIVGVDSDEKVRQRKLTSDGPPRPLIPEEERAEMVLHSRWVDYAIVKPVAWENKAVIRIVKPDVLILSEDTHYKDDHRAMEELKKLCGEVVILPRMGKRTTSTILRDAMMGKKSGS